VPWAWHSSPSLSRVAAPLHLALRRLRARLFVAAATAVAVGGAGALIGWSSLAAAHAQERNVRLHLRALPPAKRAVRVVYTIAPLEGDRNAAHVRRALDGLRDVAEPARLVRILHPLAPADESGTRVVVAGRPRRDVRLDQGRLPQSCADDACEGLSLAGRHRIGERVRLGPVVVVVVGRGSLDPAALADRSLLGRRALLLPSIPLRLRLFARLRAGTTVVATAPLVPERVHGSGLRALVGRLRRAIVRLDRSDAAGVVTATAPLPVLTALADRGDVARRRLLLVASEGAALVLAFAAFTAAARRREVVALEEQLATLGASRGQIWLARATEALVPSAVGLAVALVGLRAAGPLPLGTLVAIVVTTAVAAALLVAAGAPRPPRLRFAGPLEVAALAALGVIVWQTASTGSLDPGQIAAAHNASPILLLVPALAFFASAVLLLRLLPAALRLAERAARGGSIGVRLAALGAARRPAQAAAVTTFLAVSLGAALFSLDYRATLDRNARDQAEFAAGAAWRVVGARSVAAGSPALRFVADVPQALPSSAALPVSLLGLGAARFPQVRGWRGGFSPVSRSGLVHRLRPRPVALRGPKTARDATALRVWIHAQTQYPRIVVLHLLRADRTFAHVRAGVVWTRWQRLRVPLPASLRGAQLVGVEFLPTFVPLNHELDLSGSVELGRFEERRAGGWSALSRLRTWTAAAGDTGGGFLLTDAPFDADAPVGQGLQFSLNGTATPLIRPSVGLPRALPALVSPSVAAQAVDGRLTVDLEGRELPVRVAAVASRFPTVLRAPDDFVVLDYDTLFAALNADRPGFASPTEAWFFGGARPAGTHVIGAEPLRRELLGDPLARGTRDVLDVTALVAAALAVLGLLVGVRSTLGSERMLSAEYEALGVPPTTLVRSVQLRLVVLSLLGIGAGLLGGVLATRLVGALVAVTAGGRTPLPSIVPVAAWIPAAALLAAVGAVALAAALVLARGAFRGPAARRLTA
jgi:hypothetical protein